MSGTQSGTIDGIGYASSENVYDTLGYGVVTQTLYFDQNGTQVADRFLSTDLGLVSQHYEIGPKITNSDGTFSFEIIPTGGSGIPQGYSLATFSSGGISTREDDYTPVYITTASGNFLGTAGYTDSYTLFNAAGPGSAGTINGKYYDMVETKYDSSGVATEKVYMNDLNDTQTMVARQILVSPDPVLTLATAATASAGTAQPLTGIHLTDDWAGLNAGSLALTISVDAGTLAGYDNNIGQPFTISAGTPKHFTGTLLQIQADLEDLSYTGQAAGTAHVSVQVYDQAGIRASGQETVTVGAASGSGTTPDPVLTGVTQTSVAAGTPLSFNGVSFSDPWAANHAGTLALTVTTNFGTLSDVAGNATVNNGAVHAVGTVDQIDTDLAGLILTSSQAGTANVRIAIYDQAGFEAVHLVGVTVHA